MKYSLSMLLLPLAFACTACSSSTDPAPDPTITDPEPPSIKLPYDVTRGGLQVTAIYYNQAKNKSIAGIEDEWIVLESKNIMPSKGWMLNAGDEGQDYPLPDTIYKKLIIYTHTGDGRVSASDTVNMLGLPSGKWIWNNTDPDTARLYNNSKGLVDIFTYDAD